MQWIYDWQIILSLEDKDILMKFDFNIYVNLC
jgi:hypothetical protein